MTAPAVVAPEVLALRDKIRATLPEHVAVDDKGFDVVIGPSDDLPSSQRYCTVAAAFEDDQDAVSVEVVHRGAAMHMDTTMFVACTLFVGSGSTDEQAVRDHLADVGDALGLISSALSADRTLGGAVDMARLGTMTWVQGRNTEGAGAMVGFVVELRSLG